MDIVWQSNIYRYINVNVPHGVKLFLCHIENKNKHLPVFVCGNEATASVIKKCGN